MLASDLAVHRFRLAVARTAARPWLCAAHPGRDFTRGRKLTLEEMLVLLTTREGRSIAAELLDHFGWGADVPSASAFCKARRKLGDRAMPMLNSEFLRQWDVVPYRGRYRLLLADGSGVPIPASGDAATMVRNGVGGSWHNECHPTLAYDPLRDTFEDMVVQGAGRSNEPAALCELADRLWPGRAPDGTRLRALWLGDRNYCSYNVLCHLAEAGASFCLRASDARAESILGFAPEGELDADVELVLTRTRSAARRSRPDEPGAYRVVGWPRPLDVARRGSADEYPISLRVVRLALPCEDGDGDGGRWINLVTDLPREDFPPSDLLGLYRVRWREELGIRDLKHTVGMRDPRTRDPRLAAQELWGSLVCYNVCSMGAKGVPEPPRGPKHGRRTNKTLAFQGMRRKMLGRPVDLEAACARFSESVRPGRKAPVRKRPQRPPAFTYRR